MRLLDTLIRRITRALARSGALVVQEHAEGEQAWLDLDPPEGGNALTQLQGASIRYRTAVGPIAGRKTLRLHTPGAGVEGWEQPKPLAAERDGFSLNAAVTCRADERRLERLCRYVARPAVALKCLSRDGDGLVVYELKHPFRDGTTLEMMSLPFDTGAAWQIKCLSRLSARNINVAGSVSEPDSISIWSACDRFVPVSSGWRGAGGDRHRTRRRPVADAGGRRGCLRSPTPSPLPALGRGLTERRRPFLTDPGSAPERALRPAAPAQGLR